MSLREAIRSIFVEVGLADGATDPLEKINKEADKTKETLGGVSQEAKKAGESYRNVFLGVGAAMGVGGALGLGYIKEGTKDLAQYNDAMVTFRKNMGNNTDQMLEDLRTASAGVVSETELIQKANLAMLLGIDKNAITPMAKMARAAARQLGGDVSYYYNSLMVGTARQSKLWLDNLGIIIDIEAANKKYAQSLGISADKLTMEQQKIAFVNEVLLHQDDILKRVDFAQESLNEELQKGNISWAELQREITAGALPVIVSVVKATNWLIDGMRILPGPVKGAIGIVAVLTTGMALLGSFVLLNAAAFMMLRHELMLATETGSFWAATQAMLIPTTGGLTFSVAGLTGALSALSLAEIACLWPLIPLVAAGYLLFDLATKGWNDSLLGKFFGYVREQSPAMVAVFDALVGRIKTLWEWITKIPDAIASAWSTVTNHPLFKVAGLLLAATPIGMAINSAQIINAAAPIITPTAASIIASTSTRNVRAGDVHYKVKVGDIYAQKLDDQQVHSIFSKATKQASRQAQNDIERDLMGASS